MILRFFKRIFNFLSKVTIEEEIIVKEEIILQETDILPLENNIPILEDTTKKATLKRIEDNGSQTLGEFIFKTNEGKEIILYSMELSWKDNQRNISCIPKGTYKVVTTMSTRFKKDMWLLLNVPNRDGIRIHSANYARQLNGCIALGMGMSDIDKDGHIDITSSVKAMNLAYEHLGKEFELKII